MLKRKKGIITTTAQVNIRSEIASYTMEMNREEQLRTSMNAETLMADLEQGKARLTIADRTAKARHVSLVRSG